MNAPTEINQKETGLYGKFIVTRTDGKDAPGGKHEHDDYFVLNLTTDKHAIAAISAYAKSCQKDYPKLSEDLSKIAIEKLLFTSLFITVPETTLPNGTVVPAFQVGQYHCSQGLNNTAVVDPSNQPWHSINYHDARKACEQSGFQLITESQFLAIAYNITQQDINWTSGKVGEGEIYRGIHKGKVDEAQDGFYESDETTERRWHVLSNGERIYDFSGNIYSWVFDDVQGDESGIIAQPFADDSPTVTTAPYKSREHGIGDTSTGSGNWSGDALLRGGCWSSGDLAGVFLLSGDWPGDDYYVVGFRCTKSL